MKRLLTLLSLALAAATSFGATLNPVQLLNPAGSTSGQAIVSTGPSSAPAWGNVTATGLSPVAANSVIANFTGSIAAPVAFSMPTCSAAGRALQYSGSGIVCTANYALTTGTLNQFATTTSAQLAGVVSDETGSGSLVFATGAAINPLSTGLTAPGIGSFTTLSATGAATLSGGISGITSGTNASAGLIGQCVISNIPSGSAVPLSSNTPTNVTSIPLTAGDWLVWGNITFLPSGTTITSSQGGWTSTASATNPTPPNNGAYFYSSVSTGAGAATNTFTVGTQRINVSASATVYLTVFAVFSVSTQTAYGFLSACRWH